MQMIKFETMYKQGVWDDPVYFEGLNSILSFQQCECESEFSQKQLAIFDVSDLTFLFLHLTWQQPGH